MLQAASIVAKNYTKVQLNGMNLPKQLYKCLDCFSFFFFFQKQCNFNRMFAGTFSENGLGFHLALSRRFLKNYLKDLLSTNSSVQINTTPYFKF